MVVFARTLPELRKRVDADLERGDLSSTTCSRLAARLLDRGFFRVGWRGLRGPQRDLRPGHDAEGARAPAGRGAVLRLPRQARQAARAGGDRPRGGRRRRARSSAAAAAGRSCSPTSAAARWHDIESRRHQRLAEGGHRRGHLGQGLPHLGRHGARRRRAGGRPTARRTRRPGASGRSRARSRRSRATWATRPPWRAPPTSTRGCSTAIADGETIDHALVGAAAERPDEGTAIQGPVEDAVLELLKASAAAPEIGASETASGRARRREARYAALRQRRAPRWPRRGSGGS